MVEDRKKHSNVDHQRAITNSIADYTLTKFHVHNHGLRYLV